LKINYVNIVNHGKLRKRMQERKAKKEAPIKYYQASDMTISYNPEIERVAGGITSQSLTMDFCTAEGLIRIRLVGATCNRFNTIYRQNTDGRLNVI